MEVGRVKILGKVENLVCRILRRFSTVIICLFGVLVDRGKSHIPTKDDDATVITQEIGLSQDKQNKIRRLQANLTNMTTSLASILNTE
jgi:hypothetical protein